MSEPSEAVYEAAYEAFKRAPLGSSIVRAIVDHVWPLAVAEGRRQAAEAIVAHREKYFPPDNPARRTARRHLDIAARVAARPMTLEETAQALNEWAAAGGNVAVPSHRTERRG